MAVSVNTESQIKEWINQCSQRFQNEHMLFILHCLYELHEKSFVGKVLEGLILINLSNIPLKRTDCWVLKYCLQCCEHIRNLKLHVTSDDLKMLQPELYRCKELWWVKLWAFSDTSSTHDILQHLHFIYSNFNTFTSLGALNVNFICFSTYAISHKQECCSAEYEHSCDSASSVIWYSVLQQSLLCDILIFTTHCLLHSHWESLFWTRPEWEKMLTQKILKCKKKKCSRQISHLCLTMTPYFSLKHCKRTQAQNYLFV